MTAPRLRALALLLITLLHGWSVWKSQRPAAAPPVVAQRVEPLAAAA